LTPALTWAVFVLLAGGGWTSILFWAVIGGACGALYALFMERVLTKNQLQRIGTRLPPESSALVLFTHGSTMQTLLTHVAAEDPRLASAASIAQDLRRRSNAQPQARPPARRRGQEPRKRTAGHC
jgi:hypothetical protein